MAESKPISEALRIEQMKLATKLTDVNFNPINLPVYLEAWKKNFNFIREATEK